MLTPVMCSCIIPGATRDPLCPFHGDAARGMQPALRDLAADHTKYNELMGIISQTQLKELRGFCRRSPEHHLMMLRILHVDEQLGT